MPKKVTTAQLKKLQKSGATITTKKESKTKIDTSTSSNEMISVIEAMNNNTKKLIESGNNSNGVLLRSIVDVVKNNNITSMDINRGSDKLMTSVTFKRG